MNWTCRWLLMLLLFCLGVSPALSEDQLFIHGEITDLHLEKGLMTIRPGPTSGLHDVIEVRLPQSLAGSAVDGPSADCLAVGRHVRVWGNDDPAGTNHLVASEIRGCGRAGCDDPTGVRARLARNRRGQNPGMVKSEQ